MSCRAKAAHKTSAISLGLIKALYFGVFQLPLSETLVWDVGGWEGGGGSMGMCHWTVSF